MAELIPTIVYLLCFATSCACAWLLTRNYLRTGIPLLFWSALCFGLLGANNLLVVLDLLVFPDLDLRLWRLVLAFLAVSVLLYGFIWKLED